MLCRGVMRQNNLYVTLVKDITAWFDTDKEEVLSYGMAEKKAAEGNCGDGEGVGGGVNEA